jgi:t-SNARE complex subunit (syntaxin)
MANPTQFSPHETGAILHALGQLTGKVEAMHQATTARIEDIRADIKRLEQSTDARINRVESNLSDQMRDQSDQLSKRMDGLGTRVTSLEAEDKRLIEKVARVSALGGSVTGGLIAGAIELIKHIGK